jgi:hypothetical protein
MIKRAVKSFSRGTSLSFAISQILALLIAFYETNFTSDYARETAYLSRGLMNEFFIFF